MNLGELEAAILKNGSAQYGDTGIRIGLVQYHTDDGDKLSYMVTVPAKLAGSRLRKQCASLGMAVDWIENWLQRRSTTKATHTEVADFNTALPLLREYNVKIVKLIDFYVGRFIASNERLRISEVQAQLLDVLDRKPESERHSDHTRRKFITLGNRIVTDFKDCYIDEMSAQKAYEWITTAEASEGCLWQQKTRRHHWSHLKRLIDFAIGEKALKSDPLLELSTEKLRAVFPKAKKTKQPEVLTLKEAKKILAATEEHCTAMLPSTILSLFDGLRQHEAWQLEGRDINLKEGTVHVSETVAKTRSIRYVQLSEASKAWLKECDLPRHGKLLPFNTKSAEGRWTSIRKKAGVTKKNALRHTAGSVMFALHGEDHTKAQLGHTEGSDILFKHYRRAMTKKQAQAFADLRPEKI